MLLTAALLMGRTATAADGGGEIVYAYGDPNMNFGTGETGIYEVAIRLADPSLAGLSVAGMRIPMVASDGISGLRAWLTRELTLGTVDGRRVTVPDMAEVATEVKAGFVDVRFEEPVVIPEEGLYAGYSFNVEQASEQLLTTQPVATTYHVDDNGFYLRTSRTFRVWTNYIQNYGYDACLALQVILTGSSLPADAAYVTSAEKVYATPDLPASMTFTVANRGYEGISSVQVECDVAGQHATADITLPVPVEPVYDKQAELSVPLPLVAELGTYAVSFKVTGINGRPNAFDAEAEGETTVAVFSQLPRHRAVVEEYTGLWCAYCPRGTVALEEMQRRYPGDFIGISYHAGQPSADYSTSDYEPMEFTIDFPRFVGYYPTSWVDRMFETDPFCGVSVYKSFGIDLIWLARCKEFAPAWVDVSAVLTEDETAVEVATTVDFVIDCDGHPYQLAYILVADSLYDPSWKQNNAYMGDGGWPSIMDEFVTGTQLMSIVHRNVAVARSSRDGLEGSLPASITALQPVAHSYRFELADVLNTRGEPIIQDVNKLRVVALLIDSSTGDIVNANETHVGLASAITDMAGLPAVSGCYDLQGRRLSHPAKGIYIKAGKKMVVR